MVIGLSILMSTNFLMPLSPACTKLGWRKVPGRVQNSRLVPELIDVPCRADCMSPRVSAQPLEVVFPSVFGSECKRRLMLIGPENDQGTIYSGLATDIHQV